MCILLFSFAAVRWCIEIETLMDHFLEFYSFCFLLKMQHNYSHGFWVKLKNYWFGGLKRIEILNVAIFVSILMYGQTFENKNPMVSWHFSAINSLSCDFVHLTRKLIVIYGCVRLISMKIKIVQGRMRLRLLVAKLQLGQMCLVHFMIDWKRWFDFFWWGFFSLVSWFVYLSPPNFNNYLSVNQAKMKIW